MTHSIEVWNSCSCTVATHVPWIILFAHRKQDPDSPIIRQRIFSAFPMTVRVTFAQAHVFMNIILLRVKNIFLFTPHATHEKTKKKTHRFCV